MSTIKYGGGHYRWEKAKKKKKKTIEILKLDFLES